MNETENVVAELRAWSAALARKSSAEHEADINTLDRAADLIAHQAARLEEVTRERDEAQRKYAQTSRLAERHQANGQRFYEALTAAEAEKERYRDAVEWALGEGDSDFGDNKPENAKPFWWRTELRRRATLSPKKEQTDE